MADTSEAVLAAAQELEGKQVKVTLGPNVILTGKLLHASKERGLILALPGAGIWKAPTALAIEEVRDA